MKQSLGEYLASARGDKSQRWVADRADISSGYLSQIERDEKRPSADILLKIADVLHLPRDAVLRKAGYLKEGKPRKPKVDILTSATEELDDDEIDMVLRVVEDIKKLRKHREE